MGYKTAKLEVKTLCFYIFLLSISKQSYADTLILENFESSNFNQFPSNWMVKSFFGYKKPTGDEPYLVTNKNNNLFLTAFSEGDAITIGKNIDFDIKKYRYFSWRWKIEKLPTNGRENKFFRSDSAAGVYLLFPNKRNIKYVWSTTLNIGTLTESPFYSKTKIIVLQSGQQHLNQWISEKRDVFSDYKMVFGEEIKENPIVLGILTDSDSTDSIAIANYDDFLISRKMGD